MSNLTAEQKWELYHAGKYVFQVPGTCTGLWNDDDWFRYIDSNDWWRP